MTVRADGIQILGIRQLLLEDELRVRLAAVLGAIEPEGLLFGADPHADRDVDRLEHQPRGAEGPGDDRTGADELDSDAGFAAAQEGAAGTVKNQDFYGWDLRKSRDWICFPIEAKNTPRIITDLFLERHAGRLNETAFQLVAQPIRINHLACFANDEEGLQFIDIGNPLNPSPLGEAETLDAAGGIALDGDLAYIAVDEDGLQIFDVSDPSAPVILGQVDMPGFADELAVSNGFAFIIGLNL